MMTIPVEEVAQKAVAKKATAAKKTAQTAQRGASSVEKSSSKGIDKAKDKGTPAETKSEPETPKSRSQRAKESARKQVSTRVDSAKQSRQKTAAAVESKYRREKVIGFAEMRPKTRMLAAEYLAAITMAIILLFVHDKNYHQKMARFFVQMTGISGIFFILALGASSEKASKWVIPFGLLIDVSMLIYIFKAGAGNVIGGVVGAQPKDNFDPLHPGQTQGEPGGGGLIKTPGNEGIFKYDVPHDSGTHEIAPGLVINPPGFSGGKIPGVDVPGLIPSEGTIN